MFFTPPYFAEEFFLLEEATTQHLGPYEYTNQTMIGSMKLHVSTSETFEIKGFIRGILYTYGPFVFTNNSPVEIDARKYKIIRGDMVPTLKKQIEAKRAKDAITQHEFEDQQKAKGLIKLNGKWVTPDDNANAHAFPLKIGKGATNIIAALSDFTIDSPIPGVRDFVFKVHVKNQDTKQNIVYVVVYGKNDLFSPPRRSAWPLAGDLFRQAGTRRGRLTPFDISKDFSSRADAKGMKFVLKPNESTSCEAAFPINQKSQLEAWMGQDLDPRSMFNELSLWVFSLDGQLIFEKKYVIK